MNTDWIYLIRDLDTNCIKIGWSTNPRRRLRQIRKEPVLLPRPHRFELVDAWAAPRHWERDLHRYFNEARVRGEWFTLDNEDLDDIRGQMAEFKNLSGYTGEQEMFLDGARYLKATGKWPGLISEGEMAWAVRELQEAEGCNEQTAN